MFAAIVVVAYFDGVFIYYYYYYFRVIIVVLLVVMRFVLCNTMSRLLIIKTDRLIYGSWMMNLYLVKV